LIVEEHKDFINDISRMTHMTKLVEVWSGINGLQENVEDDS